MIASNLLDQPEVGGILLTCRDITERRRAQDELAYEAMYDPLTGLSNRALFIDRLGHALAGAARRRESIAVMFADLDGFKTMNDTHGHGVGDALLIAVARRFASCLRAGDTVARFGGDEFTVLLGGHASRTDALRVAYRILDASRQPVSLGGMEVHITTSIGIALSPAAFTDPESLLHEADTALYQAKADGKARAVVYADVRDALPGAV